MVITSLPLPRIVEDVALGPNGIAANAKPGTTYIDLSTNAPATARRCAEGMQAKGIGMLEAPVSGGTARAKDGTIVIMVGGDTGHLRGAASAAEVVQRRGGACAARSAWARSPS